MTDFGLMEFIVYGFFAYSSMLMLIISTIKEIPTGKSLAYMRVIYLIPGMVCAGILASTGQIVDSTSVSTVIHNVNSTETWTETDSSSILIVNPVWILVHGMIFVTLLIYVITQLLNMFTKHDPRGTR